MDQRDTWEEMRKQLSRMAETVDGALRKVSPLNVLGGEAYPPVNIYQDEDAYVVRMAVPGVRRGDLGLTLREGDLIVQGREDRSRYERTRALRTERGPAEFRRKIGLPDDIDEEAEPNAALDNGVLTVRVARRRRGMGRSVPIAVVEEEPTAEGGGPTMPGAPADVPGQEEAPDVVPGREPEQED